MFPRLLIATVMLSFSHQALAVSRIETAPKVDLEYASIFDQVCREKVNYEIKPAWITELSARLPALQKKWDADGTVLLIAAQKIVGRTFRRKELNVAVSLCSFPSMSTPLLVNARYSLKSFAESPVSEAVLLSTVFHEILHVYLQEFMFAETPLLKKYRAESGSVRTHLHLMALLKAAYLSSGRESELKDVIVKDESLPRPDYKRAWEIVNKLENYQDFIGEMKN